MKVREEKVIPTTRDILLKAARVMSESDGCATQHYAKTSDGMGWHAGNPQFSEAVQFCRKGAILRAMQLLGLAVGGETVTVDPVYDRAERTLEAALEVEYGCSRILEVNDVRFPGDKELAVLDLKRAAELV